MSASCHRGTVNSQISPSTTSDFGSLSTLDPREETPRNNHGGRPKRRRLNRRSTNNDAAIDRIVPPRNHCPNAALLAPSAPKEQPSDDGDDEFEGRLHPPPSRPLRWRAVEPSTVEPPATEPFDCTHPPPHPLQRTIRSSFGGRSSRQ